MFLGNPYNPFSSFDGILPMKNDKIAWQNAVTREVEYFTADEFIALPAERMAQFLPQSNAYVPLFELLISYKGMTPFQAFEKVLMIPIRKKKGE